MVNFILKDSDKDFLSIKRDSAIVVVGDYITENREHRDCVEDFLFDRVYIKR